MLKDQTQKKTRTLLFPECLPVFLVSSQRKSLFASDFFDHKEVTHLEALKIARFCVPRGPIEVIHNREVKIATRQFLTSGPQHNLKTIPSRRHSVTLF